MSSLYRVSVCCNCDGDEGRAGVIIHSSQGKITYKTCHTSEGVIL